MLPPFCKVDTTCGAIWCLRTRMRHMTLLGAVSWLKGEANGYLRGRYDHNSERVQR